MVNFLKKGSGQLQVSVLKKWLYVRFFNFMLVLYRQEKYNQCKADVARCWGRYCLVLLQVSCDRALPDDSTQQESAESQGAEPESLDKQVNQGGSC